jgi:hypothetical protein
MTRTRKLTLATLATVLGLAGLGGTAMAQGRGDPLDVGRFFGAADANHDGRVTEAEAWTALAARFADADTNKDGGLTWDEFRAHLQAQAATRRGDRPAPPAARTDRMESRAQDFFRGVDADRDGKVTMPELRPFFDATFRAHDLNNDAALSRDEIRSPRVRAQ